MEKKKGLSLQTILTIAGIALIESGMASVLAFQYGIESVPHGF